MKHINIMYNTFCLEGFNNSHLSIQHNPQLVRSGYQVRSHCRLTLALLRTLKFLQMNPHTRNVEYHQVEKIICQIIFKIWPSFGRKAQLFSKIFSSARHFKKFNFFLQKEPSLLWIMRMQVVQEHSSRPRAGLQVVREHSSRPRAGLQVVRERSSRPRLGQVRLGQVRFSV